MKLYYPAQQRRGFQPGPSGVIVAASLNTDSAQNPERTLVREEFEHCPGSKWQIK
ncbi:hypothetical protein HMPREF9345_04350 [Escherichia coli MS 107-1]|nr:hypothetical protein HMPREF9345_04350 [Escherichia coli MS 107-1]